MNNYSNSSNPYESNKIIEGDSRFANIFEAITKNIEKGSKILDIGCGDLAIKNYLKDYKFTGIDVDNRFINQKDIIDHDLKITPYPFENESFDCVICSEVLEHLYEPKKVIEESYRLLKRKSLFIITVPNFDSIDNYLDNNRHMIYDENNVFSVEHIRHYNFKSITDLISPMFDVLNLTGNSPHMSKFFKNSRLVLGKFLARCTNSDIDSVIVDQLLGDMFPLSCTGMTIVCVKN